MGLEAIRRTSAKFDHQAVSHLLHSPPVPHSPCALAVERSLHGGFSCSKGNLTAWLDYCHLVYSIFPMLKLNQRGCNILHWCGASKDDSGSPLCLGVCNALTGHGGVESLQTTLHGVKTLYGCILGWCIPVKALSEDVH